MPFNNISILKFYLLKGVLASEGWWQAWRPSAQGASRSL